MTNVEKQFRNLSYWSCSGEEGADSSGLFWTELHSSINGTIQMERILTRSRNCSGTVDVLKKGKMSRMLCSFEH